MRVLIAEDEAGLAKGLKFLLEKNGFTAGTVDNGLDALHYFHETAYDGLVLDIMMPGKNGLDVLREIRREGSTVPVLMLSAKSDIEDRVLGLETGADDYLPKPFATREFLARVKALVRRTAGNTGYASQVLSFGNVSLDCGRYELSCGDKSERLSKLVTDLVTLSRLDEETPFPEQETFSLSEACAETAESFQTRAKAEGKRFEVIIQDDLTLCGDRASVQKLLSILLDNALKYSEPGGELRLSVTQKHGKAVIEVYNTCPAPLPADLERLFDRFYRPDESRSTRTGGTGLGLAIARAIAESHRGSISASSPEEGAILFRVTL